MNKLLLLPIIFLILGSGIYAESMTDSTNSMNVISAPNEHMSDVATDLTVLALPAVAMTDGVQNLFIGFQPFPTNASSSATASAGGALGGALQEFQTIELVPTPEVIGVSTLTVVMLVLLLLIIIELLILFVLKRKNSTRFRLR